jgi:hypothetical protein
MLKSAKWASLVECENLEALKNLPVPLPRSTQAGPTSCSSSWRDLKREGPNQILRENGKRTPRQYAAQGAELLAESAFPPCMAIHQGWSAKGARSALCPAFVSLNCRRKTSRGAQKMAKTAPHRLRAAPRKRRDRRFVTSSPKYRPLCVR